ncbi:MAG: AbrB/MazE/SpoVT family DNA-binding domain-containing protein [Bryobacterales bacterium]
MPIVAVKNKYQVVIPAKLRKQVGIEVGDLLEAKVERGKVTFTPKSLVDRGIAESLEDFRKGRSHGPFETADEMAASLDANAKKVSVKRAKRSLR